MELIKIRLNSSRAMLMHADTLSDPLNKLTQAHKELTSKRKKTDSDQLEIAFSEFKSSLYYKKDIGVYLPSAMIEASLRDGAKLSKLGKHVQRSVEVMEMDVPLIYTGPKNPKGLWDAGFYDARSVKVSSARIIRYRPMFTEWQAEFTIRFNEAVINKVEVIKCLTDAGEFCGVGDYRPKFGRFKVEVI